MKSTRQIECEVGSSADLRPASCQIDDHEFGGPGSAATTVDDPFGDGKKPFRRPDRCLRLRYRYRPRVVLSSILEWNQSAQLSGGLPAVRPGALDVSGRLSVLADPDRSEACDGNGVGGGDARVNGIAGRRHLVSQAQGVLGGPKEFP